MIANPLFRQRGDRLSVAFSCTNKQIRAPLGYANYQERVLQGYANNQEHVSKGYANKVLEVTSRVRELSVTRTSCVRVIKWVMTQMALPIVNVEMMWYALKNPVFPLSMDVSWSKSINACNQYQNDCQKDQPIL